MNLIESVEELKEGLLVCIDIGEEIFNGYIIDVVDLDYGVVALIVSHDGDFEENTIDIYYEEESSTILQPDVYIL